jgi:hypothetical protein
MARKESAVERELHKATYPAMNTIGAIWAAEAILKKNGYSVPQDIKRLRVMSIRLFDSIQAVRRKMSKM